MLEYDSLFLNTVHNDFYWPTANLQGKVEQKSTDPRVHRGQPEGPNKIENVIEFVSLTGECETSDRKVM